MSWETEVYTDGSATIRTDAGEIYLTSDERYALATSLYRRPELPEQSIVTGPFFSGKRSSAAVPGPRAVERAGRVSPPMGFKTVVEVQYQYGEAGSSSQKREESSWFDPWAYQNNDQDETYVLCPAPMYSVKFRKRIVPA